MGMGTCWMARALGCALGVGLVATSDAVWAEDATAPRAEAGAANGERTGSVRVDLGIRAMSGTGGLGGAGGLGGTAGIGAASILVPAATAALEVHLGGPAWLVLSGDGGHVSGEDASGATTSSTSFALRAGPRFEWPVIDRFDAGFHVLATGAVSHAELDRDDDVEEADTIDLGGVAGASIHFRATRVFGVRVAIDVLRGGWARSELEGGVSTTGHVQLVASPAAELTFTF